MSCTTILAFFQRCGINITTMRCHYIDCDTFYQAEFPCPIFNELFIANQHAFYARYAEIFPKHMKLDNWRWVNKLESVPLDYPEDVRHPTTVLSLNEDLNVPTGLKRKRIIALMLNFSHRPNYKSLPKISFFRTFPNLKVLVLQFVGLDEIGILTMSQITLLQFVYMHNCCPQEFGFGPFKNFEICKNIQTLHLEECSFGNNCLTFSPNLRKLKMVKCKPTTRICTSNCPDLKSLAIGKNVLDFKPWDLSENPRLTLLNYSFLLKNNPLALEAFNQWLLKSPIADLKKFFVHWNPNRSSLVHSSVDGYVLSRPKYGNVHLNFSRIEKLKKLAMVDFDPHNTFSGTFAKGVEVVDVKMIWKSLKYFNGEPIRACRFTIYPSTLTEGRIPLPVPSFLLTLDMKHIDMIMAFTEEPYQLLAFAMTCKMLYKHYENHGGTCLIFRLFYPQLLRE